MSEPDSDLEGKETTHLLQLESQQAISIRIVSGY